VKVLAVHSKSLENRSLSFLSDFLSHSLGLGFEIWVSRSVQELLGGLPVNYQVFDRNNFPSQADLAISIGGDGTLLDTVTYVKDSGVPILGINTGRLGFLSTVRKEDYRRALQDIASGKWMTEERMLLGLESSYDLFDGLNFALNDFTIFKQHTSSMLIVHTYVDGTLLNSYWADGLIVSTPTGSTGYSLSAGGPIVLPGAGVFVISPISPHNLNSRPMVINDLRSLRFEVASRSQNFLISLDSRSQIVELGTVLTIKKCRFSIKLAHLEANTFFSALKSKLNWGYDVRN
jgi:NAD+ kinase